MAVGYAICVVKSPESGTYRATSGTRAREQTSQFNLVDLNLAAIFSIDQRRHGTGQNVILTARLNEAGVPVTNDPVNRPVKVTVLIRRPTEAFGTYVSTHEPTNCAGGPPQLPPIDRVRLGATGTAPLVTTSSAGGDPKPPAYAKMDQLLASCQKTELAFVEDPGTDLFDDGTNGDAKANDGIYTLSFGNTQLEGSYVFRFRASGTAPSGTTFSRNKTTAEYVRVDVDPGNTVFDSRTVQQNGSIITREYYVIPRDRFGGYLGPNQIQEVKFTTTAGTFLGPVVDYNNGIYSQLLRFDASTENPTVTGTVQGEEVRPPDGGGAGTRGFEFFPYVGGFFFDNSLGLDHAPMFGARLGYRFPNNFAVEGEAGVAFSEFRTPFSVAGRDARLVQVLANLRYDIVPWQVGNWTPYAIAGAGGVFLRGAGRSDSAYAFQTGLGSTFRFNNRVGLRADGRYFRLGALDGRPATNNFQFNIGPVFWF